MVLLLNTSEPIMALIYTLIIAGVIFVSKETKNPTGVFIAMVVVIFLLINHAVTLDTLKEAEDVVGVSECYYCIAIDLVFLLLTFISYLWVDDLAAKKKNKKSYDDSLSWFWEKL